MNPDYSRIGRRIRKERLAAGISQAGLAEKADVSPQYISLVENGRKKISLTVLLRVAEALSVSADRLLTGGSTCPEREPALQSILSGCSSFERQVILDIASAAKRSLAAHRSSQNNSQVIL